MDRLDLLSFVPFRLNRLAAEVSKALAADYARFGIDIPEWRVLATLGLHDEPCSANYVVRCTRTHKSRISRAVAHLAERGLVVRREPDAAAQGDRRAILLALTDQGRATYRELVPLLRAREARLLSGLDPDQRAALDAALLALEAALGLVHCGKDAEKAAKAVE
jgi:DNA-binding MarR family transcriptional regulator